MRPPPLPSQEDRRLAVVESLTPLLLDQGDALLSRITRLAARLSGAPAAFISLIRGDSQRFVTRYGLDIDRTDRDVAFCAYTILDPGQVLWVADAATDARFAHNPLVAGAPNVRFYAGAPLLVHGQAIGSVCIFGPQARPHDAEIAELLQDLAGVASERISGRQRLEAVERALEAASDAVLIADEDHRFVYWSEGAERLLGYKASEALGASGRLLGLDCAALCEGAWEAGLPDDAVPMRPGRVETTVVTKAGASIEVELSLAVWREEGGRRISAAFRDISERKAQADALRRSMAKAEAANLAKTAFLANMSHELRTPLNGVISAADLLCATVLTPEQVELTKIVQSSADQLRGVIGDILDLARIEAGELVLSNVVFDLVEEVDRVVEVCGLKAAEKGLELAVQHAEEGSRFVAGDPIRLRQVLINLVNNAIKFTESGSVRLTLRRLSDHRYRFEVRDTGIGFTDAQRSFLFERFQQADDTITRRYGGSGLGLTISRELIEAMGGSIDGSSAPGEGATFWFELPLPQASPAPFQPPVSEGFFSGRVLIADDNRTNLRVAELILASVGIASVTVENGIEALEAIRLQAFDAVLMDMMMPQMDGLAATRALRSAERDTGASRLPVIMLTANALPEHVDLALQAGADLHLSKPITPASLLEALRIVSGPQTFREDRQGGETIS